MSLSLKGKLVFVNIVVIVLFVSNLVYLFLEMNRTVEKVVELKEKQIIISLKAEELRTSVFQVQQWLTDISATRAENGLNDGFDKAEEHAVLFRKDIKELKTLDVKNKKEFDEFLAVFESYYIKGQEMANAYITQGPPGGNKIMLEFDTHASKLGEKVKSYAEQSKKNTSDKIEQIETDMKRAIFFSIIFASFTTVFTLWGSRLTLFPIINAVNSLKEQSKEYSEGDLTHDIILKREDEIGKLAETMEKMRGNLAAIITSTMRSSEDVHRHTDKVSRAIEEMKVGTHEVAVTMNTLTSRTESQSSDARKLLDLTNKGNQEMKESMKKMKDIHSIVKASVERVNDFNVLTEHISTIVKTIQGISTQTHILSLNASIEAARAGQQGVGFAVVAEEVRNLSKEVSTAANTIKDHVENIQKESKMVVLSLESGFKEVEDGTILIKQTGETFDEIEAYVNEISIKTDEIEKSFMEISAAIEQTSTSLGSVKYSSDELEDLATALNKQINIFKVKEDQGIAEQQD